MEMINPTQINLIINAFDYVLETRLNYQLAERYAQSKSVISFIFDSDHIFNYLEFFDLPEEQLLQLIGIDKEDYNNLISYPFQLGPKMSQRLGHATILIVLGLERFGSSKELSEWLITPSKHFNFIKPIDTLIFGNYNIGIDYLCGWDCDQDHNEHVNCPSHIEYAELISSYHGLIEQFIKHHPITV